MKDSSVNKIIKIDTDAWLFCVEEFGYAELHLSQQWCIDLKHDFERAMTLILNDRGMSAIKVSLSGEPGSQALSFLLADGSMKKATKFLITCLASMPQLQEEEMSSDVDSYEAEGEQNSSQELSTTLECADSNCGLSPESIPSVGPGLVFSFQTEKLLNDLSKGQQEYINFWQDLLTEVATDKFIDLSSVRVVSGNNHHVLISDAHDFVVKIYAAEQMDIASINKETQRSYQSCPEGLAERLSLKCSNVGDLIVMQVCKLQPLKEEFASDLILAYTNEVDFIVADPKPENFGLDAGGHCVPLDWDYCFDRDQPGSLHCGSFFNNAYYRREINNFAHDGKMQEVLTMLCEIINPIEASQVEKVRLAPVSMFSGSPVPVLPHSISSGQECGFRPIPS